MSSIGHNGGPPIDDSYPDRDGFVTIGRSIRSHPIVGFGVKGPYVPAEAWMDLIMECRYRDGRVTNGGVVMTIKPGQLLGAVSWLAQRWKWTPKQVRHFLEKLEENGMITKGYSAPETQVSEPAKNPGNQNGIHKGKQSHFITLCNYEIYQFVQSKKGQIEGQTTGQTNGKSGANQGQQYKEEHWNTGIQEQPEKEISPPAGIQVVQAPDASGPGREIGALNGATAQIVNDIASWINPYVPDYELAFNQVKQAVTAYGAEAVRDGYMELKADHADGKVRALTVKTFFGFCRVAKDNRGKRAAKSKPKLSRF